MRSAPRSVYFNIGSSFCTLGSRRHDWKGMVLVGEWTNGIFTLFFSFVDIWRLCHQLPQHSVAYTSIYSQFNLPRWQGDKFSLFSLHSSGQLCFLLWVGWVWFQNLNLFHIHLFWKQAEGSVAPWSILLTALITEKQEPNQTVQAYLWPLIASCPLIFPWPKQITQSEKYTLSTGAERVEWITVIIVCTSAIAFQN